MYFALHNINVGFIAGGAERVVIVVAVVVVPADLATEVFGEIELKSIVGALARFGKTVGGSALRTSDEVLEGVR